MSYAAPVYDETLIESRRASLAEASRGTNKKSLEIQGFRDFMYGSVHGEIRLLCAAAGILIIVCRI